MLKSLIHISLGMLLLMNGMVYSVIQGAYEWNKAEIIQKFCVNQAQPELNCDGKCYLAQQLKAEREKRNQADKHFFSADFGQYIANASTLISFQNSFKFQVNAVTGYKEFAPNYFSDTLEKPPQV